jgi:hypothetical protein
VPEASTADRRDAAGAVLAAGAEVDIGSEQIGLLGRAQVIHQEAPRGVIANGRDIAMPVTPAPAWQWSTINTREPALSMPKHLNRVNQVLNRVLCPVTS